MKTVAPGWGEVEGGYGSSSLEVGRSKKVALAPIQVLQQLYSWAVGWRRHSGGYSKETQWGGFQAAPSAEVSFDIVEVLSGWKLQVSTAVGRATRLLSGSGNSWKSLAACLSPRGEVMPMVSFLVSSCSGLGDGVIQVKCFLYFPMKLFSVFMFHWIAPVASLYSTAVLELFSLVVSWLFIVFVGGQVLGPPNPLSCWHHSTSLPEVIKTSFAHPKKKSFFSTKLDPFWEDTTFAENKAYGFTVSEYVCVQSKVHLP